MFVSPFHEGSEGETSESEGGANPRNDSARNIKEREREREKNTHSLTSVSVSTSPK